MYSVSILLNVLAIQCGVMSPTALLCIYIYINIYLCGDMFSFEINQIFLEDKPACHAGYSHPQVPLPLGFMSKGFPTLDPPPPFNPLFKWAVSPPASPTTFHARYQDIKANACGQAQGQEDTTSPSPDGQVRCGGEVHHNTWKPGTSLQQTDTFSTVNAALALQIQKPNCLSGSFQMHVASSG